MAKLKIGVLGASRGMDFVQNVLTENPYAEAVSICEWYEPLREKTREALARLGVNARVYADFDEFLASGIDAVVIANFANEHAPYAIRALRAGIHVMSEVQPVQTLHEAYELEKAVRESGKIYMYAENYCFLPATMRMRQLIEEGRIGRPMYIETRFINNCEPKWFSLTRGERDHWRNFVPSTFYCTHSCGPMLFASGLRPARVVGGETFRADYMAAVGARSGSAGAEFFEFEGGAAGNSFHGNLNAPFETSLRIFGEHGTLTSRDMELYLYEDSTREEVKVPSPKEPFGPLNRVGDNRFSHADISLVSCFIGMILGDETCLRYGIDVYHALDMALPGLLAYRSLLKGGAPMAIPDLRTEEGREVCRGDDYTTDPHGKEGFVLPTSKSGTPEVEESVYDAVKERFAAFRLQPGRN